jgi:hypothetical protein
MKKIRTTALALAGLAALGAGGSAIAGAAQGTSTPSPVKSAPITLPAPAAATDTTQQGDQSAPDTGSASEAPGKEPAESGSAAEAPGKETASGTETDASDGPGGHADPAGNVDHQATNEQ